MEDFYDGAGMVVQPKNFQNSKWLGTNDARFLRPWEDPVPRDTMWVWHEKHIVSPKILHVKVGPFDTLRVYFLVAHKCIPTRFSDAFELRKTSDKILTVDHVHALVLEKHIRRDPNYNGGQLLQYTLSICLQVGRQTMVDQWDKRICGCRYIIYIYILTWCLSMDVTRHSDRMARMGRNVYIIHG